MVRINRIIKYLKKYLNSLQFRIFAFIVIGGIIPLVLLEQLSHIYYRNAIVDNAIVNIQTQSVTLAGSIGEYQDYNLNQINKYAATVSMYSNIINARAILVNSKYNIVYDTYNFENGKTIISSEVINAFRTKKTSSLYNKKTGSIQVMTPVMDSNENVFAVIVMEKNEDDVIGFTDEVASDTYVIKIALITLIMIWAAGISAFVLRGYKNVGKQVRSISMGHYDKRIGGNLHSEMRDVTRQFNEILDKMYTLDESRQEFVSNVSHELKTPITSMKVLADSLNTQEDVPVELYKEFMQDIVDEIDRESKIIDDLLTLVKMDKSSNVINIASVNINETLELILKRLKPIAQKKNIELLFESFRPVVAQIDEVKFTIAISNLVENAIKYNNEDGWVHVSLNADHQYFFIKVEDNGIGIPKENQSMVFERFYRVDKARSRQTGGTGLGLAIVRNIILMHHGEIRLYSEEEVGTTFTVRIPLNYVQNGEHL